MPEPSLKEIESAHIDPEIGTGEPAVVYDNTPLLQTLNQNAQLKQQNDWNKYRQFLSDYETRLKNGQEIADKDIADSDRDYLKKQTVDLFSTALDNPTKIYSPEFNDKLAAIKTDAVSSKQARDFAEKNAQWITLHPEFNTDENKAKINDFLETQTVEKGGRKMFTLDVPDVFDAQKYFGGIRNLSSELAPASRVSPDNQFLIEQTNTRYKQKQFRDLINAGYESTPKIQRIAKQQYDSLPDNVKSQFKDAKEYWAEFGYKHFGTPNELDDKKQLTGNVLEYGKEDLKANPGYLESQKLAAKIANDKREDATKRYIAALKDDDKKKDEIKKEIKPLDSLLAVTGALNQRVKVSNLPINLVATIDPSFVNKDNELTTEAKDIEISVGGDENVYVYKDSKKATEERKINESALLQNITSWAVTRAKELKSQEILPETKLAAQVARGRNAQNLRNNKTNSDVKVDYNSLDPNGFKQEGSNYRYKDGTLFDVNGNVIKE